jgi:hypothetical protein
MASCILDLTGLSKNTNLKWDGGNTIPDSVLKQLKNNEWVYRNAESVIINSSQKITELYGLMYNEWYVPFTSPKTNYVVIDRGNGNIQITETWYFLQSLTVDGKNTLFKDPPKKIGEKVFVGHYEPSNPNRINLGFTGQPCKKGYYGFIGNKVTQDFFEVCFVNRSIPDNVIFDFNTNSITTIDNLPFPIFAYVTITTVESVENVGTVPVIIPDDIAQKYGLGISIVDDTDACPPKKTALFSATDAIFGDVDANSTVTLPITISNDGESDLVITDVQPRSYTNFKIGDFIVGGSIENPSVLTTSITGVYKDIRIPVGQFKTFEVTYTSNGTVGVLVEEKIQYTVKRIGDFADVTETKLYSILSAKEYSADVFCEDVDFGTIDASDGVVTKDVVIKNNGNVNIELVKFELNGRDSQYFKVIGNTPLTINAGETITVQVQYVPNIVYVDFKHSATINFTFTTIDPKTGEIRTVQKSKLFSNLSASPYKDDIDDVIDDVTGTVTGDDNGVYTNKVFSIIRDRTVKITKKRTFPLWDCAGEKLHEYYTGSNGIKNDKYFLAVYNKPVGHENSRHQFDISYGHYDGSGSSYMYNESDLMPSKVMYRKYLIETYGTIYGSSGSPTKFTFRNGVTSDSVYFIQVDRNHYKDMVDPGNFELSLAPLSSSINQLYNTGSNFYVNQSSSNVFTLIDDSGDFKQDRTDRSGLMEYYHLVSGSRRDGEYGESTDNSWGLFFPKMGLFVLDAHVLDMSCSFNTVTASIDGDNIRKLFLSISGSGAPTDFRPTSESFFARSAETALVQTYFCRVNPSEFLHSNNPTYVIGSQNDIKYSYFLKEPNVYITTIGLYNRRNELVAVGKLKKPIRKTDRDSYVFQVRLRIM